jgi:hypothetical protein
MKLAKFGSLRAAAILSATAILAGSLLANQAHAAPVGEEWSQMITPGLSSQNSFTMVFSGNVSTTLNSAISNSANYVNPFPGGGAPSVSYSSMANQTTLIFSGSSITNSNAVQVGLSGLQQGTMYDEDDAYWGNGSSTASSQVLQMDSSTPSAGTKWLYVYVDYDPPATPVPTYYGETFDPALAPPPIVLTNPVNSGNDATESFTPSATAGYMISNTEIPLDQLNFGNEPPPGSMGSMWNPIPDPGTLSPGASEDLVVPEPSSLVLIALGIGTFAIAIACSQRRTGVPPL